MTKIFEDYSVTSGYFEEAFSKFLNEQAAEGLTFAQAIREKDDRYVVIFKRLE